jgi:predicted transcriptional regulator
MSKVFLFAASKTCPLSLHDRIVYSMLVRCRKPKSIYYLQKHTKLARETITQSVASLHLTGLVVRELYKGKMKHRAIAPTDLTSTAFVFRKDKTGDDWRKHYVYIPTSLGGTGISVIADCVLGELAFLVERKRTKQSVRSLARLVGISNHTVKRTMQRLADAGLIQWDGKTFALIEQPERKAAEPQTIPFDPSPLARYQHIDANFRPCHCALADWHRTGSWPFAERMKIEKEMNCEVFPDKEEYQCNKHGHRYSRNILRADGQMCCVDMTRLA